ncbi:hypothetical protein KY311_04245 [Candidatus Woesearchaeota archaeon]|nr:hypothetical protein [Candidatus Woesearchaeota archaeon]MBW3017470.1 hypothetical protein [Candidatus Woesearchaeota archaeon]
MDNRQMICERCRKSVPLAEIKYIAMPNNTKRAVCMKCRSERQDALKKATVGKTAAEKQSYVCRRCSYKFKFNPKGVSRLKCPYCGQADQVAKQKEVTADEILKNS